MAGFILLQQLPDRAQVVVAIDHICKIVDKAGEGVVYSTDNRVTEVVETVAQIMAKIQEAGGHKIVRLMYVFVVLITAHGYFGCP